MVFFDGEKLNIPFVDDFEQFVENLYKALNVPLNNDQDTDSPASDTEFEEASNTQLFDEEFIEDDEDLVIIWGDDEEENVASWNDDGLSEFNVEDEEVDTDEEYYDTWDEGEQYQVGDNGFGDEDDE
jgi:hypothetical protein